MGNKMKRLVLCVSLSVATWLYITIFYTALVRPTPGLSQTAKTQNKAPAKMPSEAEIYAAKAKGLVWTNSVTKVYHKGGEYYGRTQNGEFMTEADAIKKYYRPAPDSKPAVTTNKK